jgi:hypothetical protein
MENKFWKKAKNALYSVPIALMTLLPSCEPENYPPIAKLDVNPLTAEVPANIRMKVTGEDPDGVDDIKQYVLYIGSESVKSSTPIDITRTFANEGKVNISGEVIDSESQSNKTPAKSLELTLTEGIEQSAALVNENEISYSATLKKIANAELTINKNGILFLKQPITDNTPTGPDYQKTFKFSPDGITKGNYEFIIKAGTLEKKTNVEIPNYKPTLNLTGINADLMEGTEISVDLTGKTNDKNPEDNPVLINSVSSVEGKTKPTLTDSYLKIKSFWNELGEYQIKLNVQSANGGLEDIIFNGNIIKGLYEYIVNPFKSTNANGAAYDLLTTKSQRDAYVQQKLFEDWVSTILYNPSPLWDCTEISSQTMINFHGFPNATGYSGEDLDSIYYYHGTLKDNGKYGLPVYFVLIRESDGPGHDMNGILNGDDLTKFENWSLIEGQRDSINVKPGRLYIPETCYIEIRAPPRKRDGELIMNNVPIAIFNVVNKIATFEQPYLDPNLKVIKNR